MATTEAQDAWRGFKPGLWQRDVNVRWFLQQNYTPYEGDDAFLAAATERTRRIWTKLEEMFVEERKKGVLDISQVPSSITAHASGYIDRENEVIVGLQTEAPLKRAIMPNGGLPVHLCRKCRRLHRVSNRCRPSKPASAHRARCRSGLHP